MNTEIREFEKNPLRSRIKTTEQRPAIQVNVQMMMKISAATLLLIVGSATANAGSYSEKEARQTPSTQWYTDTEWNVSLWGAYAFTKNDYPSLENSLPGGVAPVTSDAYLEADHAWGGGLEAKYFFRRYFGIGVEGYILDTRQSYPDIFVDLFNLGGGTNHVRTSYDQKVIGSVLGTFTVRYPIGGSRFAPYLFAAGGLIFGGGQTNTLLLPPDAALTVRSDSTARIIGQFGGGLEVRLTAHVGIINDFNWNMVSGPHNNFGMVRAGISFAF
jgi:hypothetical protein